MDDVKALTAEWGEAVYNARENWTVSPHEHIERLITAGDALHAALAAPRPSGEPPSSTPVAGQPANPTRALNTRGQTGSNANSADTLGPANAEAVAKNVGAIRQEAGTASAGVDDARPSGEREAPACPWTEDEDGIWHTGCGRSWFFETGDVEENRQTYCMGCGHLVAAAPFIEGGKP